MATIKFVLFILFMVMIAVFSILRKRINYKLYNSEYGTNFKPLGFFEIDTRAERLLCEFHYFYFNVKPENKRLAILNNIMSATILGTILTVIIWFNILNKK